MNDTLLNKTVKISSLKTKKDTVNKALQEFIQTREQQKTLNYFEKIDHHENYNPKEGRN